MLRELSQITLRMGTLAGSRADAQYAIATQSDAGDVLTDSIYLQTSVDISSIDEGDKAPLALLLRLLADSLSTAQAIAHLLPTLQVHE